MKKLYVVRHCKAEGQAAEAQLTEAGCEQAVELADFFSDKDIDYIISSPFERAVQSISPLVNRFSVPIVLDHRLAERVLSGNNHPEWREMLRKTYDDMDLCYEGGESSNTAMNRAAAVIMEVLNNEYTNSVIVTHGNLMSLLLRYFDNRYGFNEWQSLTNPDVYLITVDNDKFSIQRIYA